MCDCFNNFSVFFQTYTSYRNKTSGSCSSIFELFLSIYIIPDSVKNLQSFRSTSFTCVASLCKAKHTAIKQLSRNAFFNIKGTILAL